MSEAAERIDAFMLKHGLAVQSAFIPLSKSRNAPDPKAADKDKRKGWRSLNWRVTLLKDGREILSTDYSAGEARAPAYKRYPETATGGRGWRRPIEHQACLDAELETGFEHKPALSGWGDAVKIKGANNKPKEIKPDPRDVFYSIASDCDVINNYSGFEDWATSLGFDPDSRKAESIYRQCLEMGLKVRAHLGEPAFSQMFDAIQDY